MTICAHFASILIHDKILLYILWNWIKSMKSNCSSHLFISTFLHKGLYLHRQSINVCRLLLLSKYMNFYVFFLKKIRHHEKFPTNVAAPKVPTIKNSARKNAREISCNQCKAICKINGLLQESNKDFDPSCCDDMQVFMTAKKNKLKFKVFSPKMWCTQIKVAFFAPTVPQGAQIKSIKSQ